MDSIGQVLQGQGTPCPICGTARNLLVLDFKADKHVIPGVRQLRRDVQKRIPIPTCQCQETRAQSRERKIRNSFSATPDSWAGMTFEDLDFDPARAPDLCRHRHILARYLGSLGDRLNIGEGLTLFRNRGTAKTTICGIVLNKAADLGLSNEFMSATEICDGWRSWKQREAFRSHVLGVQALVIDELGGEPANGENLSALLDVVNIRYRNRRATLVTFNHDHDWLIDRYSNIDTEGMPRLLDRLKERNIALEFTGESYRDYKRPTWHKGGIQT